MPTSHLKFMQPEKKSVVTNLARLVNQVKLECEAVLASEDYGLERLSTVLDELYGVMEAYLAPEYAAI